MIVSPIYNHMRLLIDVFGYEFPFTDHCQTRSSRIKRNAISRVRNISELFKICLEYYGKHHSIVNTALPQSKINTKG